MYLASVFTIFVTVMLVFVQSQHGHHMKKHNDYTVSEKADCEMHRSGITKTIRNANCKPHDRHVALKPMPGQLFRPSVVSVKRCDGNCPGSACMPLRKHMVKVPVKSDNMCVLVEVEEHIDCRCMCLQKEEDCNDKQHYDRAHCACQCKNQEIEKQKCEQKMGMIWDDTDCTCNCTQMNMECTSGLNWNHDICACK